MVLDFDCDVTVERLAPFMHEPLRFVHLSFTNEPGKISGRRSCEQLQSFTMRAHICPTHVRLPTLSPNSRFGPLL
jgi:hypothetical protein